MKKLEELNVLELKFNELNSINGGDEPAYAFGHYLHYAWGLLTMQYTGDCGILCE